MVSRHRQRVEDFRRAVLESEGELAPRVRRKIYAAEPVEGPLDPFVDKVRRRAHAVTDEDVAALRRAGLSEDHIFEASVAAALGAGLSRLDRALDALDALDAPDPLGPPDPLDPPEGA
jgi:hypothetical protein